MTHFRPFLATLLFACATALFAQEASLSRLSVSGNQFVNEAGDTVVLRGYNTSDPDKLARQGMWTRQYLEEVKSWGANVVRFPVHPTRWSHRGEEAYLRLLDEGIQWATALGLYVIIDWHSIGNLKDQKYQDPMYDTTPEQTFAFWQTISKQYGDNPTVAFYELYNEPTTNSGMYGQCTWAEWKTMNEQMITLIRQSGGRGIPLVAGFNWAYDLTQVLHNPVDAEGIGYVSHPYPQKREKPWEAHWTADWGHVKEKYPLILTEIGFCGPEDVGAHIPVISDDSYGDAITAYCDERDISYVVWVFDAEWAPRLFDDWSFTPSRHGKYFKKKLNSYPQP